MRSVLLTAGAAAAAASLYYLYQRQLGAVSFFILSIFFFYLAFGQVSKSKKTDGPNNREPENGSEKREENDR